MNGVEVSAVAGAMDTLSIMGMEARALTRVAQEVGHTLRVRDVLTEDQFIEFCMSQKS
jgi:hypothetical protein